MPHIPSASRSTKPAAATKPRTFAELHERLGWVPLERIRMDPAPGTATDADVDRIKHCELIDGTLVEKAMGTLEGILALFIGRKLGEFVEYHDLGLVAGADGAARLAPGNVRIPDIGFFPWSLFPNDELPTDAIWSVTPTLVVEVLSRTNTAAEIDRKLRELFASGCRLAWVIDPPSRTARVHTSATKFKTLAVGGSLDGGRILPGFTLPLADIFASTRRRRR